MAIVTEPLLSNGSACKTYCILGLCEAYNVLGSKFVLFGQIIAFRSGIATLTSWFKRKPSRKSV
jgi:hypothetical protein